LCTIWIVVLWCEGKHSLYVVFVLLWCLAPVLDSVRFFCSWLHFWWDLWNRQFQRRAWSETKSAEHADDDGSGKLGEITLTTLSLDTQKKGPIVFFKHSISLPSLDGGEENIADTGDNSKYQRVSGVYSKEGAGQLKIAIRPTNGNASSHSNKPVQIAQLDPTHIG